MKQRDRPECVECKHLSFCATTKQHLVLPTSMEAKTGLYREHKDRRHGQRQLIISCRHNSETHRHDPNQEALEGCDGSDFDVQRAVRSSPFPVSGLLKPVR